MGINFWTGAFVVVVATGVYTIFGGLRAVLYTDLLQMFVLVGGSVAVTVIGIEAIGGWGAMYDAAGGEFFNLWKPMSHPDFPWTGILFGAPILGVWYWCTDQFIVQRVLAAKDLNNARRGTIFAGFLKILPLFIFVIPGVIAYTLAQRGEIVLGNPDEALPTLIATLLPVGFRGLVVAALLAALMSSLSSVFNSCSTLITWDIYKKLRPEASEKRLVLVGQVSTAVLVGFGLLWIPMIKLISGQLYHYLQSVQAYISPPIAAVFLLGVFWRRVNSHGAIASLATGFVLGIGRLIAEINKDSLGTGILYWYSDINFLHFAILLFVICAVTLTVVSLMTPEPSESEVAGITFQTRARRSASDRDASWRRTDLRLSITVIVIVGLIWLYFSG
jgi:SSS family solute:Na+ symporter